MELLKQKCPFHGDMILASTTVFLGRTTQHWVCAHEQCPVEDVYIDLEEPDEDAKASDAP